IWFSWLYVCALACAPAKPKIALSSAPTESERRIMMHTEIAFANERAIIADMLIKLLTNVRLTYVPDLEPADAHELLLTGAHVLIAQLAGQPATASAIDRAGGRPGDVVTQGLAQPIERGYVEHSGNRYTMTAKFNVSNLPRHMRSNIGIIQAAARRLDAAPAQPLARGGQRAAPAQAR